MSNIPLQQKVHIKSMPEIQTKWVSRIIPSESKKMGGPVSFRVSGIAKDIGCPGFKAEDLL